MDIERKANQLVISLSNDEVFRVMDGNTIGERRGLLPDSKVEILPLSDIMPDDSDKDRWTDERLKKAQTTPLYGRVLSNQDLQIGVPQIVLRDVRVIGRRIGKEELEVLDEGFRETIPNEGIQINFGGSLKIIDLYQ